jgi:hypothetical protein
MTRISRGEFFIGRKMASAISAVLSALIIFDMASLTEHRLLPNLIDAPKNARDKKTLRRKGKRIPKKF